jgi:hypothetical protein
MVAFSKKTAQAIRQERLLAELQITGLIPKPRIVEKIGDAANSITETLTTAFSAFGPLSEAEKAMDSSRRAVMAVAEDTSRQGAILSAADHVAKKRSDNLSFDQGGLPKEAHVAQAMEYLERMLAEHRANLASHYFRNMMTLKGTQPITPGTKPEPWLKG